MSIRKRNKVWGSGQGSGVRLAFPYGLPLNRVSVHSGEIFLTQGSRMPREHRKTVGSLLARVPIIGSSQIRVLLG